MPSPLRDALSLGVLLLAPACAVEASDELPRFDFVDVAEEAGITQRVVCGDPRRWYIPESNGSGAAWLDYDGDGDMDLFLANGARLLYHDDGARLEVGEPETCRLYRNDGGMRFTDVTAESGAGVRAWVNAVAAGDVDNDGDPDLYLACFGGDVFLRNEGGRFVEATREAGLGNELWGAGAAFGDADGDGALDLYVANYCLFDPEAPPDGGRRQTIGGVEVGYGPEEENGRGFNAGAPDRFWFGDGRGGFRESTREAGFALEQALCSYAVVFADVDLDGRPDVLVANDLQPCQLFRNLGGGRFAEEGAQRGFATGADGRATAAMGLMVADIDQDGDLDVLRTNFDLEANSLHLNDGRGYFREVAGAVGLAEASLDRLGWGGGFFDADLDGDLDLLVANGHVLPQAEALGMSGWLQGTQLFEAVPHERFRVAWRDVSARAGSGLAPLRSARGVAFADADGDGDVDVLVVDLDERPRLLENRSRRHGNWIGLRLEGSKSNRDALGARVRVEAGARSWTAEVRRTDGLYSSHDPTLRFGLGPAERARRVEIRWPSGTEQVLEDLEVGRVHHLLEP